MFGLTSRRRAPVAEVVVLLAVAGCADNTVALAEPDASAPDGASIPNSPRCSVDPFGRPVRSADSGWVPAGTGWERTFATVEDGCVLHKTKILLGRWSSAEQNSVCNACDVPMGMRGAYHGGLSWWGSALFIDRGPFLKSLDCAVRCRGNDFPLEVVAFEMILQPGEWAGYSTEQPTSEWSGVDSQYEGSWPGDRPDPGPLDPQASLQLIYPRFESADQDLGPPLAYASVCAEQGLYDSVFRRAVTDAAPQQVDPARVLRVPAGTLDAPAMLLESQPTTRAACNL
jgi:hypothetical protein